MPRDLNRTTASLEAYGLGSLLTKLMEAPLDQPMRLPFRAIKTAKAVQRLLYQWLWFYPEIKERVGLSLDGGGTLIVVPKWKIERRGRRPL